MDKKTKWAKCAGIRALKTFAQAVLGMITVGATMQEVDWMGAVSVGVVAAIYSILTSLAGLPEVEMEADEETEEDFDETHWEDE